MQTFGSVLAFGVLVGCESEQSASSDACEGCTIKYERVATIGDAADPWSMRRRHAVRILKRRSGEYLVFEVGGSTLARYDPHGRYLNSVGGTGSGPGEFRMIWAATVDDSDSLFVYDDLLRRVIVFSPDLHPARTFPFPHEVVWFSPFAGGFVVHGHDPDSIRGRHQLHMVSKDGDYVKALDEAGTYHGRRVGNSVATRSGHTNTSRLVVLHKDTTVLTVFEARHWDSPTTIGLEPAWYPGPPVPVKSHEPTDEFHVPYDIAQRPARGLMDVRFDGSNVWTLAWVEAPDWAAVEPPFGTVGSLRENMENYWVGQIELYDGRNWSLLAATTLPFFGLSLVGDNEVARIAEREDGLIVLDIYQLSLEDRLPN